MLEKNTTKSVLYEINPIIKGIGVMGLIILVSFFSKSWIVALNFCLIIILLCLKLKFDIFSLLSSVKKIWLLLLCVGLFQGFSGDSFNIWSSLSAILKILAIYMTAKLYVLISSQNELLYFWEICFKPLSLFGISSQELALMMVIAIRFLPVLMGEIERIRIAQIARGAKLSKNSIVSTVNMMPLLIPILVQSIMRADELSDAMLVRGYVAGRQRGRYKKYYFTSYDFVAIIVLVISGILICWH